MLTSLNIINIIYIVKYYLLYSNHNSKGTMIKFRTNYSRRSYQEAIYGLRVQIFTGLDAKRYKRLRRIIADARYFTG